LVIAAARRRLLRFGAIRHAKTVYDGASGYVEELNGEAGCIQAGAGGNF